MNSNVYIFGVLSSGYTQYPNDSKDSLFRSISDTTSSKNMMAVRREGNLLYYVYSRRLNLQQIDTQYLGFAIELNGLYYNEIQTIFSLFEEAFASVVLSGKIIGFSDEGDIAPRTPQIHYEQSEVSRVFQFLHHNVNNLPEGHFKKLPPINFAVGLTDSTQLIASSTPDDIDRALAAYNILFISKDSADHISGLSGYSDQVKRLSGKIQRLSDENSALSSEILRIARQKKRTTVVTVLSLLVAASIIVFIAVGTNLSEQVRDQGDRIQHLREELKDKQDIIDVQNKTLKKASSEIRTLEASLSETQEELTNSIALIESLTNRLAESGLPIPSPTIGDNMRNAHAEIKGTQSSLNNDYSSMYGGSSGDAKMSISEERVTIVVGTLKNLYAYNYGDALEWESNDSNVASVSSDGVVKGISTGTTTIWAKGKDCKKCIVTVVDAPTKVIAGPGEVRLKNGQTAQLKNGAKVASKWESDNVKVATVSSTGLVRAVGKGKTNVWGYFEGSPKRYLIEVE